MKSARNPVAPGESLRSPLQALVAVLLVAGTATATFLVSGCRKEETVRSAPPPQERSATTAATSAPPPTPAPSAAADAQPEFDKLVSKWLRTDGDYVLEIKHASASGKLDAAYFNPRPIRVSRAEASRDGTTTKVFIELRDEGYPGCTYTLTYDPQDDLLKGIYFQAAMQEKFQVAFERAR